MCYRLCKFLSGSHYVYMYICMHVRTCTYVHMMYSMHLHLYMCRDMTSSLFTYIHMYSLNPFLTVHQSIWLPPSYKHGIPVAPSPWCSLNITLMYVRRYQTLIPSIPSFPLQQTTLTTVVTRVHILDLEVTHVEWQHDGGV